MKIGILTHPQGANYGGILQCYALCAQLKKMGHEPIVIHRVQSKSFFLWEWIRTLLKTIHFPRYYNPNKHDRIKNIRPFIDNRLNRTKPIHSQSQMQKICQNYQLNAIIVGSDQVWRKDFSMKFGYNYFLDFVPNNVKKLSYAASFGLSDWQYNEKETINIYKLLSRYSGISVRETEAVSLIQSYLGIKAQQHIDPTLLLNIEDYKAIMSPKLVDEKYIFIYWLGNKELIKDKIRMIENSGIRVITVFLRDNIEHISIEDWLSYIMYSERVITDSFHGCVFSILFHKQFEIFSNKSGGNGRISSLFNMLNIKNLAGEIDYTNIDFHLTRLKENSISYLKTILR